MGKRIFILSLFVGFAVFCLWLVFVMTGTKKTQITPLAVHSGETVELSDALHSYSKDNLSEKCENDDYVFCAIEKIVKCTIDPKLSFCDKGSVPSFVLVNTKEDIRPTEIRFFITKMKPVPDSKDIVVYTKSECNASWFGLCQGTVIYSLTSRNGIWEVNNIYALEE